MASLVRSSGVAADAPVIEVSGLSVAFETRDGAMSALEKVSFDIWPGETVALVGESGSGKSVTSLSLLGLLPSTARITAGRIRFRGRDGEVVDVARAPERVLRGLRGSGVSMIFQEPLNALNPAFTIGGQVAEAVRLHRSTSSSQANARARDLLARVGIADPDRRMRAWPHELSGGMRQRVMIAMAVASRPALLIADEPTTALDVTTQAQVITLLSELQAEIGMGLLFITHNLALASLIADRVVVMYAGEVVEAGTAAMVLGEPRHPYTRALLDCLPARHLPVENGVRRRLPAILGAPPRLGARPTGCAFAARCAHAADPCGRPANLRRIADDPARAVRCVREDVA
jgi:peptide/nickel transport system ATP-binding protein